MTNKINLSQVAKILFLAILGVFFNAIHSNATGARKKVECRTLDRYDNVLANGNRCDFGWSECLSNPCPSPDGTRVEYETPSMSD